MKYRYSKLAFICSWLLVGSIVMLLLYLFGILINASEDKFIKVFMICPAFYISVMMGYYSEYSNRYIELFDDYIKFNSFRFKRLRNVISLKIRYEDVIGIKSKSLPLIGLYAIKICAKNIPHDITLSICFKGHKKMFKNICRSVSEHNNNVIFDSYLEEHFKFD